MDDIKWLIASLISLDGLRGKEGHISGYPENPEIITYHKKLILLKQLVISFQAVILKP